MVHANNGCDPCVCCLSRWAVWWSSMRQRSRFWVRTASCRWWWCGHWSEAGAFPSSSASTRQWPKPCWKSWWGRWRPLAPKWWLWCPTSVGEIAAWIILDNLELCHLGWAWMIWNCHLGWAWMIWNCVILDGLGWSETVPWISFPLLYKRTCKRFFVVYIRQNTFVYYVGTALIFVDFISGTCIVLLCSGNLKSASTMMLECFFSDMIVFAARRTCLWASELIVSAPCIVKPFSVSWHDLPVGQSYCICIVQQWLGLLFLSISIPINLTSDAKKQADSPLIELELAETSSVFPVTRWSDWYMNAF